MSTITSHQGQLGPRRILGIGVVIAGAAVLLAEALASPGLYATETDPKTRVHATPAPVIGKHRGTFT
ncbi:hypothetical protein GCM10025771_23480 [Niveibacterium umoris]|uniref:Putative O-methyltransferase YrrM n=1 Tax=Niveibacterium umoris TaxID=1193620 RepID=A0A840BJB4_9RHOO|nr:hypothetical protein [Niveibacterium umoris]MBB4012464.1 putative O-methyltransferase YrrM [Niveibacterium umoris]